MVRIAINGFGRIGRNVTKIAFKEKDVEVVAINDLTDIKTLAHLMKYDSVYGNFDGTVEAVDNGIKINGKLVKVFAERDPEKLPWKDLKVDIVAECTGIFCDYDGAYKHIKAGAKKVLISAPSKGDKPIDKTIVMGVNNKEYDKEKHSVISNASCTTNCLAPLVKVINDAFGIKEGIMNTVHAYTNDQALHDVPHKDLRRARAGAVSIIPTTTGAAKAVSEVIPSMKGKLNGIALRVPVITGSIVDLTFQLNKPATIQEINAAMKNAANGDLKGIIQYTEDPIVSVDVIKNTHSCIFDALSTMQVGSTFKVLAWYDNEWGYSTRMVDVIRMM